MIMTYNHDMDWILETAFELGMEVGKVCVLNYTKNHIFRKREEDCFDIETRYRLKKLEEDI